MKEQLINEVLSNLVGKLDAEQLNMVKSQLHLSLEHYEVKRITTDIVVYNGTPRCVDEYIATRIIENLSKNTIDLYRLRLKQFFQYVRKDIKDITKNDIMLFMYRYQEETHISNRTLDNYRSIITTFFAWASAEGYCDKNPAISIKKVKYVKTHKEALDEMELEKFRNACETIREKALVEFMYSTGARVSEVCNVKIKDINFDKGEVILFGKGSKYRTDYLSPKSILIIKEYIESRKDNCEYLFVSLRGSHGMVKKTIEYIIDDIWKRSGIEKKVTPHILRHTTATISVKRGVPVEQVQKMLGHENINTTMVYTDVLNDNVKRSHAMAVI